MNRDIFNVKAGFIQHFIMRLVKGDYAVNITAAGTYTVPFSIGWLGRAIFFFLEMGEVPYDVYIWK